MKVCGFIVLRKPIFNYDEKRRGAFLSDAPQIDGVYYAGIDRMPWFELDEGYYAGNLPDEFMRLREELLNTKQDLIDFKIMRDIRKTIKLLDYSNKDKSINEIVAIYSDAAKYDEYIVVHDVNIEWLGMDIYCHGYGSLIREGIFRRPDLFTDYLDKLNKNGLFSLRSPLIDKYIDTYTELAHNNTLEPIDGAREYLDCIGVGRIELFG
jgi:hypothetical protein